MLYRVLKHIIRFFLYFYHKEIQVHGLENIPKNKPVLFVPNHQNALIDVLLVGVDCKRNPYFLARSDIFGKSILNSFFKCIKMIPIYRIRDGRNTLAKNDEVFDICAQVLTSGEAIVMFPEGNHSLKRRVRPLSKGFTRVLFRALERSPNLDIQIIPVGLNYTHAERFPDSVAVYYGEPIAVQALYNQEDILKSTAQIKDAVSACLKTLTTHIPPEVDYKEGISYLESQDINFLEPKKTNHLIKAWSLTETKLMKNSDQQVKTSALIQRIFILCNLPVILCWRLLVLPKVPEPEFMSTFRFATSFFGFFLYLSVLFLLFYAVFNFWWAFGVVGVLGLFNWFYIKRYPL